MHYNCTRAREKIGFTITKWILWRTKGKLGYNAPRDTSVNPAWYFNQRLLNFNQYFASDAACIFFARSVYKQYHWCSSVNVTMHKFKPDRITTGMVKNFEGTVERFVSTDNTFSFMSSVEPKEHKYTGKSYYLTSRKIQHNLILQI